MKSGECIDCYHCVDVCPRENITTKPIPAVTGTIAAIGIIGIYYAGTLGVAPALNENVSSSSAIVGEASDGQIYTDGVYTGVGSGFRGEISVEVTVENGLIIDILVISSNDDKQFFDRASNSIISSIISTQSVDVDAVSGATFSSNGIIEAVADALNISFSNPNIEKIQREHGQKGNGHGKHPEF